MTEGEDRPLHHRAAPGGPPPRSGEDLGHVRHRTVGASNQNIRRARKLRKEMSLPEVLLWRELRGKPQGLKFRRQFPVFGYVTDFACTEVRLLIEVDGIVHEMGRRPKRDEGRDAMLADRGWQVIRIAAKDVLKDCSAASASIVAYAASLKNPPRSGEELQ